MAASTIVRRNLIQPYRKSSKDLVEFPRAPLLEVTLTHRGTGMAFPAIAILDSGCDATCISHRKLQQMEKEMGKAAPTPWGYLPFYVTVSCGDERFRLGPPDGVCLLPAAFPLADQEDVLIGRDILNGRRVECDGLARLSSDVLGAVAIEVFETERLT